MIVRGGRLRAVSTAAQKTTIASFANSDGCSVSGPATIQRSAPLMRTPMPGTLTSSRPASASSISIGASRRSRRYGKRAAPAMQAMPSTAYTPSRIRGETGFWPSTTATPLEAL